jgi:hypothetical protein
MWLSLSQLVFVWMLALVPRAPWASTMAETAQAIANAADADPLVDQEGAPQEIMTAALLTSIAFFESRFNLAAVGDAGASRGAWQVKGRAGKTADEQARIALGKVHQSYRACPDLAMDERLSAYAAGDCVRGRRASRTRVRLAMHLVEGSGQ